MRASTQRLSWILGLGFCASLTSSCAGLNAAKRKADEERWQGRGAECVRAFLGKESPYQPPSENGPPDPILSAVPPEARRTAKAAGIEGLVADALRLAQAGDAARLERLEVRQDLNMRVVSLETQLSAMIFEAECTGEMIETISLELTQREENREVRLALVSLVLGAASATAAGAWDLVNGNSNGPAITGLTGGIAAAGIGVAAFVPRPQLTSYRHDHNLLSPIVRGVDDDQLYPAFVFRLLTLDGADGRPSPRQLLVKEWQHLIESTLPAADRQAAEAMLFGSGGLYDQTTIDLRERMYDALETRLNALARDLELLDRFLVRALEQRTQGTVPTPG
ncbi:MAG: hypothetical protein QM778_30265 [Myxococcales bacterium]